MEITKISRPSGLIKQNLVTDEEIIAMLDERFFDECPSVSFETDVNDALRGKLHRYTASEADYFDEVMDEVRVRMHYIRTWARVHGCCVDDVKTLMTFHDTAYDELLIMAGGFESIAHALSNVTFLRTI